MTKITDRIDSHKAFSGPCFLPRERIDELMAEKAQLRGSEAGLLIPAGVILGLAVVGAYTVATEVSEAVARLWS